MIQTNFIGLKDNEFITHLEEFTHEGRVIRFVHDRKGFEGDPNEFAYSREFERYFFLWKDLIKKESIVLDIGAFNGDSTLPMSYLVGEKGIVYCFEPSLLFASSLSINLEINNCHNTFAYNFALTDGKDGIEEFKYDPNYENGGNSIETSKIGNYTRNRWVVVRNIKNWASNIEYRKISFIKSDTEGSDIRLLNNISDIIREIRCPIQVEWFVTTTEEIARFLINNNYHSMDFNDKKEYKILPPKWTDDLILIPN